MKYLLNIAIYLLFVNLHAQEIDYDIFSSHKIIGLGEETHGIKSINEQRNAVAFGIAKKYAVKYIIWEESFAEMLKVNELLKIKEPDYDKILKQFTWFWQTDETLALLKFIHAHNVEDSENPIMIHGMDLSSHLSMYNHITEFFEDQVKVESILSEYSLFLPKFETYKRLKKQENKKLIRIANSLLDELKNNRSTYASIYTEQEIQLMKLNIKNVIYTASYYFKNNDSRDLTMFKNLDAITALSKKHEKVIVYAHNGHLMKRDDYEFQKILGFYIDEKYKGQYYALGYEFGSGSYLCSESSIGIARTLFTAIVLKKSVRKYMSSKVQEIELNPIHTALSYLDSLNSENAFFDVSSLDIESKLYKLLTHPQLYHNIGGGCSDPEDSYLSRKWSERFDGIFFIKKVEATNVDFNPWTP